MNKQKPGAPLGATGSPLAPTQIKTVAKKKRDDNDALLPGGERKRSRTDDSASNAPTDGASVGDDKAFSREERKLKQQMALFAKIEERTKRKEKERRGEDDGHVTPQATSAALTSNIAANREDVYVSLVPMSTEANADELPADANAAISAPLSPNSALTAAATARSQRAKLRAEREEEAAANMTADGKIESAARIRRPRKRHDDDDDGTILNVDQLEREAEMDITDFAARRRAWRAKRVLQANGPFYLGKKSFALRDWTKRHELSDNAGWIERVVTQPILWTKKLAINFNAERSIKQEIAAASAHKSNQIPANGAVVISDYIDVPLVMLNDKQDEHVDADTTLNGASSSPTPSRPASPVPVATVATTSSPAAVVSTISPPTMTSPPTLHSTVVVSVPLATNRLPINGVRMTSATNKLPLNPKPPVPQQQQPSMTT